MKIFYLLLLTLASISTFAQNAEPFMVNSGFGQFILGSDKAVYGTTMRSFDTITYKGITDYFYVYSFNPPYRLAGIPFLDVALTFDKSNKLKQIHLPKVYTKKLFANYKEQAYADFKTLIDLVASQAGKKGKKKKRFNSVSATGYEWTSDNAVTWLYIEKSASQIKKATDTYFITLVFMAKE